MYHNRMMSEEEIKRIAAINIHLDEIISDDTLSLETYESVLHLKLDVEWLCGKLSSAWSVVRDYQEELDDLYKEHP
jgi:hypothetical protein